jgi:hypothetical protein
MPAFSVDVPGGGRFAHLDSVTIESRFSNRSVGGGTILCLAMRTIHAGSDGHDVVPCPARAHGGRVVLLGALVLTGCASAVAICVPQAGTEVACITPAPNHDVLVGVALSGGGSRAALIGAAGLEALGRLRAPSGGSVLEQVAYLSSVSGGSVASTYYASLKPPRETPVLTPDGALTDDYQTFFAEYQKKLSQDAAKVVAQNQQEILTFLEGYAAGRAVR